MAFNSFILKVDKCFMLNFRLLNSMIHFSCQSQPRFLKSQKSKIYFDLELHFKYLGTPLEFYSKLIGLTESLLALCCCQ